MPAVDGASAGPVRLTVTGALSTFSVVDGEDTFAGLAASLADNVSDSGPLAYCVVSIVANCVCGLGQAREE